MQRPLMSLLLATAIGIAGPLSGSALPAAAAPAMPAIVGPQAGAASHTNPVLKWTAPTSAVKYQVQISTTSDFAAVVYNLTTANTAATPPSDLAVGSYFWRVRAVDSSNGYSAYRSGTFEKVIAAAPVVTSPFDGQTLKYPSEPLVLAWEPMAGAKNYDVQIDDDAAFVGAANPVSTANNSYTPENPPLGTTYYWRVRGKSAQGVPTQYSEPRAYSMVWDEPNGAAQPRLLSPTNTTSSTIEEVRLDWAPLRGASAYELQISPDQFFNAPIGGTRVVNSTAFSPSPTLPAGSYYWRVRGINTSKVGEPGPWSETWAFTRAWPASDADTRPRGTSELLEDGKSRDNRHAQVELLFPQDGDYQSVTEPVFAWQPQRGASHYELHVGPDANFSPNTYSICLTNHTVVSPYNKVKGDTPCTLPKVVPTQVLYWRVRAVDSPANSPAVYGVFSDVRSFLYDARFIRQTAPSDGAQVDVPVLRWDPVDNISHYKVTMTPTPAVSGCSTVTATTYNTVYVPESLSEKCTGPMSWTVQSVEDDGQLSRLVNIASWPQFTIVPPSRAGTLGPVTASTTDSVRPPLLRWNSLTNAVSYRVFFSVSGANSFSPANKATNQPAFTYTGNDTTWAEVLTPGRYDYYVQAFDKDGASLAVTSIQSFTIGAWPSSTLVSPAKCLPTDTEPCALHDTPTLDWEPLKNIGLYHVYLATDPNFTNITKDWVTTFSELTPTESLADSQAGEAYYWYVRPCYTSTACAPFDSSVFANAGAFRKESAPVAALSPVREGAALPVVEDEVTFTWTDYLTTNEQYDGVVPPGSAVAEVVTQEARNYQVQVSTTAEFTNIIETSPFVDQTSYTAQTKTYPDGPLFWRVRAFDESGNPLTYSCAPSTTRTQRPCSDFGFEKKSPAPAQQFPTAAKQVDSSPSLQWEPMPYAETYQVEVYRSPDSPLNSTNRVVSLTTRSTAAISTSPLPKGDYGWRVRRVDTNGLAGAWTTESNEFLRRFTVAGPQASLVVPADQTTVQPNDVLLQWEPVAGASRYKVEVSRDGFATVLESVTTDMTSWAPGLLSPKWPAGQYTWRVTTLDSTGKPLADPASRRLTMDGPGTVERWYGSDRFATSAAISAKSFPVGVDVAYVASGIDFPDALSAAPVAGKTPGPVLLTNSTSLPGVIATELNRLKPKKIVVVGSAGAVSDSVKTKLSEYTTGPVDRWYGSDRFATSAAISAKSFQAGVEVAYVASGIDFPDALSAAPVAGKARGPVLLTNPTSLPGAIATELTRLKPKFIVVVGSAGAVSDSVKDRLASYTTGTVDRWYGSDRFSTSAAISAKSFQAGVDTVYVASATNFPDALSAAPVAGKTPGPVLLTNPTSLPGAIATELTRLKPKNIVVVGSSGAVSDSVKNQLTNYLR